MNPKCLYVLLDLANGDVAWVALRAACRPTDAHRCKACANA